MVFEGVSLHGLFSKFQNDLPVEPIIFTVIRKNASNFASSLKTEPKAYNVKIFYVYDFNSGPSTSYSWCKKVIVATVITTEKKVLFALNILTILIQQPMAA